MVWVVAALARSDKGGYVGLEWCPPWLGVRGRVLVGVVVLVAVECGSPFWRGWYFYLAELGARRGGGRNRAYPARCPLQPCCGCSWTASGSLGLTLPVLAVGELTSSTLAPAEGALVTASFCPGWSLRAVLRSRQRCCNWPGRASQTYPQGLAQRRRTVSPSEADPRDLG